MGTLVTTAPNITLIYRQNPKYGLTASFLQGWITQLTPISRCYSKYMDNIKPILSSWLQSSQDPTQVSNAVRGAVLSASAVIIFVAAQFFHVQLSANDVISLATEAGALAGAIWFFYGLLMKGVVKVGSTKASVAAGTLVYNYTSPNTGIGLVNDNTINQ